MKWFNNKIYYVLMLLVASIFSSCSDWLDYEPEDKSTAAQQFSTRAGFYAAVNGVYNRITEPTLYGQNLTYGMLDLMGKRYVSSADGSSLNAKFSSYNYADTDFRNIIDQIWRSTYETILNINVILDYTERQDGVLLEKDKKLIKGDLLALRAFLHFDMLRLFGPIYFAQFQMWIPNAEAGIPYNNEAKGQSYDILPAKTVVYDRMIPDLNEAEKLLEEVDPVLTEGPLNSNNKEGDNYQRYRQMRINYFAVALLKARAYLWMGDMANALAEAKKITDNPKVKEFFPFVNSDKLLGNNLNPDRIFSTEVLFGFYNSDKETIYTSNFDSSNLNVLTGLLQPRVGYIETLFKNQADYRRQSQWTSVGNMFDFVKFKKITYDRNNIPFYAFFMPLMRVSEAYYIATEACLTKGETENIPAARNYLSTILKARGLSEFDESLPSMMMTMELQKEYMREFWGEGQIFFLFKRLFLTANGSFNAESTSSVRPSATNFVLPLPISEQENR